ncbi:hypothetical protein T10_10051 [Trichinella papuae]|uniref:Uncharacterized protein n=1 Tax=Trichinella papuae TaxID=268474 RepID=A0A0V1M1C8_9BILA|nr:hypothetical protein T10_10051 [Trichinella papuae]
MVEKGITRSMIILFEQKSNSHLTTLYNVWMCRYQMQLVPAKSNQAQYNTDSSNTEVASFHSYYKATLKS